MDWIKQTQNMMASWSKTQQKMADQWLDAMQHYDGKQATEFWQQTVSTYENLIERTLEAQTAWLNSWMDQLKNVDNMPEEVREQAEQGKAMLKRWTEMQQQLWQTWFEVLRQLNPSSVGAPWEEEARKMFETWRETVQRTMEQNEKLYRTATSSYEEQTKNGSKK